MNKTFSNFMPGANLFTSGNFSMLKEALSGTSTVSSQTMETNNLVRLAKQGNMSAFEQIYDLFIQRIFKFVRMKIQNQQEAEDIVQETFVKAFKGLAVLKLEDLNFSAWLYRIASNTINDHFRKKYRTPDILAIDENFDLPDHRSLEKDAVKQSDLEIIKEAFNKLTPLYKQVLELRFFQDLSLDETARIVNKSNLSVRLIQFRALKKVQLIINRTYTVK